MNLKIREFKVSIENYVNSTDLPLEVKRIVLKGIYDDLEKKATEAIAKELKEQEVMEKEEKQDE